MKKADLLAAFGTLEAIGAIFAPLNKGKPLSRSAIGQWGETIPALREYQIRELVPDVDERIASAVRRCTRCKANLRRECHGD